MKKLKNALVSVLLFSFMFLVMHDFAMQQIETYSGCKTSLKIFPQSHEPSNSLKLVHDIHENIHKLVTLDENLVLHSTEIILAFESNYTTLINSSDNTSVLERPPLS